MLITTLFALTSITGALASPTPDDVAASLTGQDYHLADADGLPTLRLSRREVDEMKANLEHPGGTVIGRHTFPADGTDGPLDVPVRLIDPDWLLEGEEGDKARALAKRQGVSGSCLSFRAPSLSCAIGYCWRDSANNVQNAHVTITRTPNPFRSDYSISRTSQDRAKIDIVYVDPNGSASTWETGHKCTDPNPFVHTIHRMSGPTDPLTHVLEHSALRTGAASFARVMKVNCRTCDFGSVACGPSLRNRMLVLTNGAGTGLQCQ
ncbi:Hypothetical protein D9617_80g101410 [Elsinoe fawcettii]|nr:Hypothetical protein D9617_80g101410 [Elsinoe fawcettii]